MPRQLSSLETIKALTGLIVTTSQVLESPTDPWLWELEVHGPQDNGALLPWASEFEEQWDSFAEGKRFFLEIDLLKALTEFIKERYFKRNGT